jgi:hypothetical protein
MFFYASIRMSFLAVLEFELSEGFVLAKQALYHLSHNSSPFCSGYFEDS